MKKTDLSFEELKAALEEKHISLCSAEVVTWKAHVYGGKRFIRIQIDGTIEVEA